MNKTMITSRIYRTDTFPLITPISPKNNKGYISFKIDNWSAQMFYELPCIKIDLYTDVNGENVKCKYNSSFIRTYYPQLYPNLDMCYDITNLPDSCYIAITPIFDTNAIAARNMLIENGLEQGKIWTKTTNIFDIEISFITE